MTADAIRPEQRAPMSEREFIALAALLIAQTALSTDIMLPALPEISDGYALADPNDRQMVISAYLLGFAFGHPLFGPLADRFGRRSPVIVGLALASLMSLLAAFAPSFTWMLVARALQGVAGAGTRVIATAMVRDRFGGREMARVMSIIMSVFIIVPVLAPSAGGLLVAFGEWRWIFFAVAAAASGLALWTGLRLEETLRPVHRLPLQVGPILRSMAAVARHRFTLAYGTAQGFQLAAIFAYIVTAQQIFSETYGLGELFPLAFSAISAGLIVASLTNSRLVGRLGMRPISRAANLAFIAIAALHAAIAAFGNPPLLVFASLLTANLFMFGLILPNLNALAMEPHGARAGIAAAYLGFYATLLGIVVGGWIGTLYDGSVLPLVLGYVGLGLASHLSMWLAEIGPEIPIANTKA